MEVRLEGKCGPRVKSVDEVLRQVEQQLREQQGQWLVQLRDHPAQFADLEARGDGKGDADSLRECIWPGTGLIFDKLAHENRRLEEKKRGKKGTRTVSEPSFVGLAKIGGGGVVSG